MGHVFGADDYYNTDEVTSYTAKHDEPSGSNIMMSHNICDHDAFTKLAYGWVDPYVVTDSCTITITPSQVSGDCIILADSWNGTAFDEYIIFELYTPTGLNEKDAKTTYNSIPGINGYGIRAYHIDARLVKTEDGQTSSGFLTDAEMQNWDATIKKYDDQYYFYTGYTNSKGYDIASNNYSLIQLIQRGKTNTLKNNTVNNPVYAKASDLFKTGDTFDLASYRAFFPRATSTNAVLNNGSKLNYTVTFDSVTATSATITFTKVG